MKLSSWMGGGGGGGLVQLMHTWKDLFLYWIQGKIGSSTRKIGSVILLNTKSSVRPVNVY
jgi:hypothetical protein